MTAAIEMRQIVKRFPGVVANDGVDFTLAKGEIHALLGENGAGKSTLMQVLYGFYRMDAGEIHVDGRRGQIESTHEAIALGIGMVHQEFMLVQTMTVVENVVLGLRSRFDVKMAAAKLRELSKRHSLEIDPYAQVRDLPIGVQQRVEILKLLYRDARVLILDEPTAVLTAPEKDRLFAVLRELRAAGRSVVIVTHKLHEIMELADRVTVMRDGRVVGTVATNETTGNALAQMMVGREVNLHARKAVGERGARVLTIADLHVKDEAGQEKVRGLSLDVHAGEIVGIAGVDGNGQSQLAQAVMGLLPVSAGKIELSGADVTRLTNAQRRKMGLGYVPADRRGVGSVTELSIAENAMLGSQRTLTRGGFLDGVKIWAFAQGLMARFDVRGAGMDTTAGKLAAGKLSGGNLQKVILGREILRGAIAMVVEQPTRGLDAGAVETIWEELLRERERGVAMLVISAELDELMNLADRIAVMFEGRVVGVVDAKRTSLEELGGMMAGGVAIASRVEGA